MTGIEIGLALSAVSTVMGVVGSISQGQAQKKAADYQAQVAKNNATIAQQNAQYAVAAGESKAQSQDFKNRAIAGAIESGQAASGIDLSSPTLADVRSSSAQIGRLDTANVMADAMLVARGQEAKASDFTAEAGLKTMEGENALTASYAKAGGTLLSGAGSFADKWNKYQSPAGAGGGDWGGSSFA
jgi:hypothetical protein